MTRETDIRTVMDFINKHPPLTSQTEAAEALWRLTHGPLPLDTPVKKSLDDLKCFALLTATDEMGEQVNGLYRSVFFALCGMESADNHRKFKIGDQVTKLKGSQWRGTVVGFYSTGLTPIGYCVESSLETGSVQIYPEAALGLIEDR